MEKLKNEGKFEEYKRKRALQEKLRRNRRPQKNSTKQQKIAWREASAKYREKKRIERSTHSEKCGDTKFKFAFGSESALGKAVAKVKRSLPKSPSKTKAVLAKILSKYDPDNKKEIMSNSEIQIKKRCIISELTIVEIKQFYQRDDISRLSPNVKDFVKVIDESGIKIQKQIRHLMYSVREVYAMYIEEFCRNNENLSSGKVYFRKFKLKLIEVIVFTF